MFLFPNLDPIAFSIFGFGIRWYALAYLTGVMLGWRLLRRVAPQGKWPLSTTQLDDFVVWVVLGVVLGGRFGYVFFYQFSTYIENPLSMLQIWHGGMSFHGGLTGVLLASWLYARRIGVPFLRITDLLALVTPIGIFLGRIANFINGELVGRPTDGRWGMVFPHVDQLPRHPSQLYEAGLEGLLLGLILWLASRKGAFDHLGMMGGIFLAGYGAARILAECFREPDAFLGTIIGFLTMGQILSLPLVAVGGWLVYSGAKQHFNGAARG